jgi:hypothetical protein
MVQPAQTGTAAGHRCGEWLVDFMGYCGGEFSERRHASDVREFRPSLMHLSFNSSCFSDIHNRTNEFELIRSIFNCVGDNMDVFD